MLKSRKYTYENVFKFYKGITEINMQGVYKVCVHGTKHIQ